MNYYIVIPAYNEEKYIALTITSLLNQTLLPQKIVIVNDNSTDATAAIVTEFIKNQASISLLNITSSEKHLPGSKVVNAFQAGYESLNEEYDFIVKADADLIFPTTYFENISKIFKNDPTVGMAGGFAYIEKNNNWVLENLTDKDHIRGAFKAYRKNTFKQIGGLKPAMGWDTVDELLCKFYGWKVQTDSNLKVKHLKPTGANYNKLARYKQGEAFYCLGYGFLITLIAAIKLALLKKRPLLIWDYLLGFWKAKRNKKPFLVTNEQAKFIRNYRIQKMISKLNSNPST